MSSWLLKFSPYFRRPSRVLVSLTIQKAFATFSFMLWLSVRHSRRTRGLLRNFFGLPWSVSQVFFTAFCGSLLLGTSSVAGFAATLDAAPGAGVAACSRLFQCLITSFTSFTSSIFAQR